MAEDRRQPPPPPHHHIPTTQDPLSSVRLQHFNYLSPAASAGPQASSQQQPSQHFQSSVAPAPERRHYSFDTDTESQRYPLGPVPPVDYDQTEGLGGVSVSSYDSIDDDRIDPAVRGYPYHGEKPINYHAPDHGISYMTSSLYPSNSSYPVEDAAGGGYARGDRTPSDISSSISPPNGQIGNNKYSTIPPGERLARALSIEEQSRLAVEEDKRRRNTAASARFRVKKKQREQALERAVREATEVKSSLEARVTQLEMENRWLKNLLTEKNENLLSRLAALQPSSSSEGSGDKSDDHPHPHPSPSLLPPLASASSTSLTAEQQQQQQQQLPKKSDSSNATAQKPIKPKLAVGVGTDDKK
ncbi:hypothetical protein UA08_08192 [Talaromyces atroroseus]|uniref:BZIP domain-containing protein n=1 Tax=Talaromyces atroroseus TaxID=1441469 RepID=A0A225ALE8_TALAT|nr:hypothetical protein UA08_08192 [Talaromyces atroroseus]OKL56379.1 hypothetical protein UA08_08192 [Talaromyces atroroseus]